MDAKRKEELDTDNVDSFFLPGGILDTPGIDSERPSQDAVSTSIGLLDGIDIGLGLGLAPGVGTRNTRASTSRFVSIEHPTPRSLAERKEVGLRGSAFGEEKPVEDKAQQWLTLEGINPLAPEFTPAFPNPSIGEEKSPDHKSGRLPDFFTDGNISFEEEELEIEAPSPSQGNTPAPISRPLSNSNVSASAPLAATAPLSAVDRIQQELAARQAQHHRDAQQQQQGFSTPSPQQGLGSHQPPAGGLLAQTSQPQVMLSQQQPSASVAAATAPQQQQQRRAQAHQQRLAKQRQQLQLQKERELGREKERDLQVQMARRQSQQQQTQQRYKQKEAFRTPPRPVTKPPSSGIASPGGVATPPMLPGPGIASVVPPMGGRRRQERSTKQTWQQQQQNQAQANKAAAYSGSKVSGVEAEKGARSSLKNKQYLSEQALGANSSISSSSDRGDKSDKSNSKSKKEDDTTVFQGLLAPTATKARRSRVCSQEVDQPSEDHHVRNRKATSKKAQANKGPKAEKSSSKDSSKAKSSKKEASLSNQPSSRCTQDSKSSSKSAAATLFLGSLRWWLAQSPQLFGKQGTLSLVVVALRQLVSLVVCLVGALVAGVFALLLLIGHLHHYALRETLRDFQVALCFVFPYSFRFTMTMAMEWAPHWAPVCIWYAFLVQIFCTGTKHKQGCARAKNSWILPLISRIVLPLLFIAEGVSGRSFLLELSGSELLLLSFLLAAIRMRCLLSPIFMVSWAIQVIAVSIIGPEPLLQYCQLLFALTSLHKIVFFDYLYHGRMCRSQSFPRSTYELSGFAQIGAQLSAVSRSTINH